MPLALSPNSIGAKDPHALQIPARKGGIRLTSENAAVAVHADRDDGVCPDRSSRKPRTYGRWSQTSVAVPQSRKDESAVRHHHRSHRRECVLPVRIAGELSAGIE